MPDDKLLLSTRFQLGVRIIEDPNLTEPWEDWSRVRSPARARRRMRYGFRQNMVVRQRPASYSYSVPGAIIMHPEIARQLRAQLAARVDRMVEQVIMGISQDSIFP